MIGQGRDALRRKYLSLGTGELIATWVFVVAATAIAPRFGWPAQLALWSATGPLLLVLVQGGGYWLAARQWVGRGAMPARLARLYRVLRVADPILLAAGLVGVWIWWPDSGAHALTAVLVWLFGVVEYLNYFVVRLPDRILANRSASAAYASAYAGHSGIVPVIAPHNVNTRPSA